MDQGLHVYLARTCSSYCWKDVRLLALGLRFDRHSLAAFFESSGRFTSISVMEKKDNKNNGYMRDMSCCRVFSSVA